MVTSLGIKLPSPEDIRLWNKVCNTLQAKLAFSGKVISATKMTQNDFIEIFTKNPTNWITIDASFLNRLEIWRKKQESTNREKWANDMVLVFHNEIKNTISV